MTRAHVPQWSRTARDESVDPHRDWPCCPEHPGAPIRRYRMRGPQGIGVYLQCLPTNGEAIHLIPTGAPTPAPTQPVHLHLTDLEREILADAAAGHSITASAEMREEGRQQVKSLRRRIMFKLEAQTMTQAVSIAIRHGLVERRSD